MSIIIISPDTNTVFTIELKRLKYSQPIDLNFQAVSMINLMGRHYSNAKRFNIRINYASSGFRVVTFETSVNREIELIALVTSKPVSITHEN